MMLTDEIVDVQRLEDGDAEGLPNDEVVERGGSDDAELPNEVIFHVENSHDARLPDDVGFTENEVIDITSSGDDEIASRSTRPRGRGGTRPNAFLGLLRPHLSASSLSSHSSDDSQTSLNRSVIPYSASDTSSDSSDDSQTSQNRSVIPYVNSETTSDSSDNSLTSQNGNSLSSHSSDNSFTSHYGNIFIVPSLLDSLQQIWDQIVRNVNCVSGGELNIFMQRREFARRQYDEFYKTDRIADTTSDVSNILCTICTEQDASLDWMMLPCGHIYCTPCIGQLFRRRYVSQRPELQVERCPVCQCSLRLRHVTRLGVRPGPGQDIVPAGGITTQTASNGLDPGQNIVPTGGITEGTVENPLDLTGSNSSH